MNIDVQQAIKILNNGGIIIFPTDTAYGIGCRMDNEKAIERLFEIRKRPLEKSVPVLVESIEMAQVYTDSIPQEVEEKLINPFWPGALTIVLKCKTDKVPSLVRGGKDTLGVRMPNHSIPLELIKGIQVPLLAPSANFHGNNTPFAYSDLDPELLKLVDFIVEGETSNNQASTVIDCSTHEWKILREGAIKIAL